MLMTSLMMAATLVVSPAVGDEPDGVISTAPETSVSLDAAAIAPTAPSAQGAAQQASEAHGLTTDEQIDQWIAARSPDDKPYSSDSMRLTDDRKMHGEVDVGIGTGGYRSYGAAVSLPIGENGRLNLSYTQVENGYGYGYPYRSYGRGYGDYGLGGYYNDSGYAFPGRQSAEDAIRFENRVARPGGPPGLRPLIQPQLTSPD
jgi:hypothetical protein